MAGLVSCPTWQSPRPSPIRGRDGCLFLAPGGRLDGMTLTPDDRAAIKRRIQQITAELRVVGLSTEQHVKLNADRTALEKKLADDAEPR
jgi:hypothetical protein